MSSPTPKLEVFIGFLFLSGTRCKPQASAISITAVFEFPSIPHLALIYSPRGPDTFVEKYLPWVAVTKTSTVPSPPSAIGNFKILASGKIPKKPSSIAFAASEAVKVSLKESGAINIFIFYFFNLIIFFTPPLK